MERTVIFVNQLDSPKMRGKITHYIDLEPTGRHVQARALEGIHQYKADAPLVSYFVPGAQVALVKKDNPPHRFVFLPEFTNCRLTITADGTEYLRLQIEQGIHGAVPPPESHPNRQVLDCFSYWDYTKNDAIGVVRGTAVLFQQPGERWHVVMQQIVGIPGNELVRQIFMRPFDV